MAKPCAALCLLLVLAPRAAFGAAAADDVARVSAEADRALAPFLAAGSPGCAVVVVAAGKPILRRGYGLANLDDAVPIGPQSVFHVASLSKQFTAWAILALRDEGRVDLDAPVRTYLKDLPDAVGRVTLRQLLGHTSGIRDQWQLLILSGWRLHEDVVRDSDVMRLVRMQRSLDFAPGAEFSYSNTGYTLLGQVVRAVSGMSLRDFTTKRLFLPLGMKRTFFRDDHREIVAGLARAYEKDDQGRLRESMPEFDTVGATSLLTTADDMALWAAHLDASDALEREMEMGNAGPERHYGAGWFVSSMDGETVVEHSGTDAGYHAHFLRFPRRQWTAVTLCNAEASPRDVNWRLASAALGVHPVEPAGEVPKLAEPAAWSKYEGVFLGDDGRVRRIVIGGGKLREDVDTIQYALRIDAPGSFRNPNLGTSVSVRMEEDRPVALTEVTRDGAQATYRAAPAWRPTDLRAFEGRFRGDEVDNVFEFHVEGGTLVMSARKDLHEELEPTVEDGFNSGLGHFQFVRDAAHHVVGLRLSGERVRGLRLEKE